MWALQRVVAFTVSGFHLYQYKPQQTSVKYAAKAGYTPGITGYIISLTVKNYLASVIGVAQQGIMLVR